MHNPSTFYFPMRPQERICDTASVNMMNIVCPGYIQATQIYTTAYIEHAFFNSNKVLISKAPTQAILDAAKHFLCGTLMFSSKN